jgi:hypothetical protein
VFSLQIGNLQNYKPAEIRQFLSGGVRACPTAADDLYVALRGSSHMADAQATS